MELEQLKDAVEKIALTEDAKERILNMEERRREMRRQRRRMQKRFAVVCVIFIIAAGTMLFSVINHPKWSVTVYAQGKEGAEWIRLKPSERVLLQKEENEVYYRLKLDLPEHYCYERSGIILGQDHIWAKGEEIYWLTDRFFYIDAGKETGYELPEVMSNYMYIKILDEDGNVVDAIRLEVSKEYDRCYVELGY